MKPLSDFSGKTNLPIKVLVIDDSELARVHFRRILSKAGMEVFEQASAIGATREILKNSIDAVVVDISMPGLSGDRLVGLLREHKRLSHLVIVVVSAKPKDELARLSRQITADAVLSKEDAEASLVSLVRRLHERALAAPHAGVGDHHA